MEVRQLEQWFLRITDYAERLLNDLDGIEWPEHVKTMQRNWIGRSEGAEVTFRCEDLDPAHPIDYPVFTTRPDTLFGATFFVMAPEHPDVARLAEGTVYEQDVHDYVNHALNESNEERGNAEKPKTGVPLGRTVTNPVNGEQIPMYVADYVLMEYGTGAIMAVPGHDERDYAFARAYDLPIRRVIEGPASAAPDADPSGAETTEEGLPYPGDGPLVNSHPDFDGMPNREALSAIVAWLDREGKGHASVNYRLRDWLVSRQRYWGCPIPIVNCERCGIVPVPEDELPVELPDIEDYTPKGRSPLEAAEEWVKTKCPECGGPARRETDTMDTFVDSSWYFLRYCDASNEQAAWDPAALKEWMPVDQYIGGVEHAILHLMYARFFMQGARRPRPPRLRRAVQSAVHAGDGDEGRREDEQVPRQRGLAGGDHRALRRRHRPLLHPLHRASGSGCGLVRRGHGGSAPVPEPAVASGGGDGRAHRYPGGRRRRGGASAQGALGDRQGLRRPAPVRVQHGDRRGDGAAERMLAAARERERRDQALRARDGRLAAVPVRPARVARTSTTG